MAFTLKDRLARQVAGDAQLSFDPTGRDEPRLATLPLSLIDPDPEQPRRDPGDLADLALSIREHGVLQPLIVEAGAGGRYRLLTGERRFTACRSLGLETAPCLVRTVAEHARLALQLIENVQRKDLHPLEEAAAYKRLMDQFNLSQRDLARRVGKSVSSINETLRLLDLQPDLLAGVRTSEHANKSVLLEITKEPDPVRQRQLWTQAQAGQLTVRQARTPKAERPPAKPRAGVVTLQVTEASVVIRFASGEATPERVRAALAEALAQG